MSGREIKKIINSISQEMKIKKQLFVRVVPFRRKIASVSFASGKLRLNRDFVKLANISLLKYIIIHELVHVKLGHHYHNDEFYKEMNKYLEQDIDFYDKKVWNLMVNIK